MDFRALLHRLLQPLKGKEDTIAAAAVALLSLVVGGVYLFAPDIGRTLEGRTLAGAATRGFVIALGPATLLVMLLAGVHAMLRLLGRGVELTPPRIASNVALLILVPCLFALLGARQGAAGGVVGLLARDAVLFLFPPLFAVPLLTGLTLLALVLSTDWLFYGRLRRAAVGLAPAPARRRKPPKKEVEVPEEPEEEDEEQAEEVVEVEAPAPAPPPPPVPVAKSPSPRPLPLDDPPPRARKTAGKSPLPPLSLLEEAQPVDTGRVERAIQVNAQVLEKTLLSFRIEGRVVG